MWFKNFLKLLRKKKHPIQKKTARTARLLLELLETRVVPATTLAQWNFDTTGIQAAPYNTPSPTLGTGTAAVVGFSTGSSAPTADITYVGGGASSTTYPITSVSEPSGNLATITITNSGAAPYQVGESISLTKVTPAAYTTQAYTITSVTDATHFVINTNNALGNGTLGSNPKVTYGDTTWRVRGTNNSGDGTNNTNAWDLNAPEYSQGVQLDTSTVGYENIQFSFDWYATTQGIRDLALEYCTNTAAGTPVWTLVTGQTGQSTAGTYVAPGNDYYNYNYPEITVNLSSITTLNNDPNVGIRLVSAYDSTGHTSLYASAALSGGQTVPYNNSSGNWSFDNLTFAGTAGVAPSFTNPASTDITGGSTLAEYPMSATGSPTPTAAQYSISQDGAHPLPSWVSYDATTPGQLDFTNVPTVSVTTAYYFDVEATTSSGTTGAVEFIVYVDPSPVAPSISSANTDSIVTGQTGTFQVVASGVPSPTSPSDYTITNTPDAPGGALAPSWVTFDGTTAGQLDFGSHATVTSDTNYYFTVNVTTTSGSTPQAFVLTETVAAPQFVDPVLLTPISSATDTINSGTTATFQVLATGAPTPTYSLDSSPTPPGFVSINSTTGLLTFTNPAAGVYNFSVDANNGVDPSLPITLDVDPTITSTDYTSFIDTTPGNFSVTSSDAPATYSIAPLTTTTFPGTTTTLGSVPSWLNFNTSTGALTGTPPANSAVVIDTFTITATVGGASGNQTFTLYLDPDPVTFTGGNLIVGQVGDSTTYNVTAPEYLDEFPTTAAGPLVQQVAIPTVGGVGLAANQPFTVDLTAAAGVGQITQSEDGSAITLGGLDENINGVNESGAANRVVAQVTLNPGTAGGINTQLNGQFDNTDDLRSVVEVSAATAANNYSTTLYTAGHVGNVTTDGGTRYFSSLSGSSTGTQVTSSGKGDSDTRDAVIGFDGRLYWDAASSGSFVSGIYTEEPSALPTSNTGQTDTLLVADPNIGGNPNAMWLADMNGTGVVSNGDRLYFVDDGTTGGSGPGAGGLYVSVYESGSWGAAQWIGDAPTLTTSTKGTSGNLYGLTGVVSNPGTAEASVTLYATSYIATSKFVAGPAPMSYLVQFVDNNPYGWNGGTGTAVDATATNLQSIQETNGQGFRGVAFVPVTATTLTTPATTPSAPSIPLTAITFTSTLTTSGGTPISDGTVNFDDGNTLLGTATTNTNGVATFTLTSAAAVAGTYSVTAYYAGNSTTYGPATSAADKFALHGNVPASLGVVVSEDAKTQVATTTLDEEVTLTATVGDDAITGFGSPTGYVTFEDNGTVIAGASDITLTPNGDGVTSSATFTTGPLSAGANVFTVVYSGDSHYANASGSYTTQVNPGYSSSVYSTTTGLYSTQANAGPDVTVTSSSNSPAVSGEVTLTASVSGNGIEGLPNGSPTGSVYFYEDVYNDASALVQGQSDFFSDPIGAGAYTLTGSGNTLTATVTVSGVSAGSHLYYAVYDPDPNSEYVETQPFSSSALPNYDIVTAHQAFAPGDLVILRRGDGNPSNFSGNATQVFLDEYTPTGTLVQSIAMPNVDSGDTHILDMSGKAGTQGSLELSANGEYLTLAGFDLPLGTANATSSNAATVDRVIGRVDADGNVDTSTTFTVPDGETDQKIKGAVTVDGNEYWIMGDTQTNTDAGIGYTTLGSSANQSAAGPANISGYVGEILGGELYVAVEPNTDGTATSPDQPIEEFVPTGGTPQTPLSATSTTGSMVPFPGLETAYTAAVDPTDPSAAVPNPYAFVLYDSATGVADANSNVLYVADQGSGKATDTGGLLKFYNSTETAGPTTGAWVYAGTDLIENSTTNGIVEGLVGTPVSNGDGTYHMQLYLTANASAGSGNPPVQLWSLNDDTAYNATIAPYTDMVLLATAPGQYPNLATFSGIAFAPTLPDTVSPTTTTLSASKPTASYGNTISFTATVSPTPTGSPAGSVAFYADGVQLGSAVTVTGGVAVSAPISTLALGTHNITAVYSGDSADESGSAQLTQDVGFTAGDLTVEEVGSGSVSSIASSSGAVESTTAAVNISSASEATKTVTITTSSADGLVVGQEVTIAGFTGANTGYNGSWAVASVPTTKSFTYTATATGLTAVNGTGTATGSIITITTTAAHGLSVGQSVAIAGVSNPTYDLASALITSVPSSTTIVVAATSSTGAGLAASGNGTLSALLTDSAAPVSIDQFSTTASTVNFSSGSETSIGITQASESGGTVTVTTSGVNALVKGQIVTIAGMTGAGTGYNGKFAVASVTSATVFTYTDSITGLAVATAGNFAAAATAGGLATITTASADALSVGQYVTIAGVPTPAYDGTFRVNGILNLPNNTERFTFYDPTAGTTPDSSGTGTITANQTPNGSLALPTTSGASNQALTDSTQGNALSDGLMTISTDQQSLAVFGYDAPVGTSVPEGTTDSTNPRIIGSISANGTINTTTEITDAYNTGEAPGVYTLDGQNFYAAGFPSSSIGGVQLVPLGSAGASNAISSTFVNSGTSDAESTPTTFSTGVRGLEEFDGQLYLDASASSMAGIATVGAGIPTSSGIVANQLDGIPGSAAGSATSVNDANGTRIDPEEFVFADPYNVFIADGRTDGLGGIEHYNFVPNEALPGGGSWQLAGVFPAPVNSGGFTGLAVDLSSWTQTNTVGSPTTSTATIYATTVDSTGAGGNLLVKLSFTTNEDGDGDASDTFSNYTVLANAPANESFRGLTFAPIQTGTDTASFSSFTINGSSTSVSSTFGSQVTFSATVSGDGTDGAPTGVVSFRVNGVEIGASQLISNGDGNTSTATFIETTALSATNSPYSVTAVYTGDATYAPTDPAPITLDVTGESTATTLTAVPGPAGVNQNVTITATVASENSVGATTASLLANPVGTPGGYVTFEYGSGYGGYTQIGAPQPLVNGVASITNAQFTNVGSYQLYAFYTFDATEDWSASNNTLSPITEVVGANTTTIVTSSEADPGVGDTGFYITATVTPTSGTAEPTGSVAFTDQGFSLSSYAVSYSEVTNPMTGVNSLQAVIGPISISAIASAPTGTAPNLAVGGLTPGISAIEAVYTPAGDFVTSYGAMAQSVQANAFGANDLLVYAEGDGTDGLANSGSMVYIDEYSATGTLQQTIVLPIAVPGPTGYVNPTTGTGNLVDGLVASGVATAEGELSLSSNGEYVAFTGFDTNLSATSSITGVASSLIPRVVAEMSFNGTITMTDFTNVGTAELRAAYTTDGNSVWFGGNSGGVEYFSESGGSASLATVSTTQANVRELYVYDGQLYQSSDPTTDTFKVGAVGTGLPTGAGGVTVAATALPGIPDSATATGNPVSPYGFFMTHLGDPNVPTSSPDTIYITEDGGGADALGSIEKWSLVGSSLATSTWVLTDTISVDGVVIEGIRQLSGEVSNGVVTLDTSYSANTSTGGGWVYTLQDSNGWDEGFSTHTLTQTATDSTTSNLAIRGLAFVPMTPTTTTITSHTPNPATSTQTVTFTVTVTGGSSTDGEIVTLEDQDASDAVVGTGTLMSGSVSIPVSTLSQGAHSIFAVYPGDSVHLGSISTPNVAEQVLFTTTTGTPATTASNPVTFDTTITITATVSPTNTPNPGGTITFYDNGSQIGSPEPVSTVGRVTSATIPVSFPVGDVGTPQDITAQYNGDGTSYAASPAQSSALVVNVSNTVEAPTVSSVVVNGDTPDNLNVAGNHSRVTSLYVTFSEAVQFDSSPFTLALHNNVTVNGLTGQQVGTLPGGLAWSSSDNIHWTVTFTGTNNVNVTVGSDGHITIMNGVYDFTINASNVHPLGSPSVDMAASYTQTFWALFGDSGANDSITHGTIGDGTSTVSIGIGDFNGFANSFGSASYNVAQGYNPIFDVNGDGSIDVPDFDAFANTFGTTWKF